jgi:hypothetical protein
MLRHFQRMLKKAEPLKMRVHELQPRTASLRTAPDLPRRVAVEVRVGAGVRYNLLNDQGQELTRDLFLADCEWNQ